MNTIQTEAELRQITLFKDSVLSAADATRIKIIADAQQQSNNEIANAQKVCKQAQHSAVQARISVSTQRQHSAAVQIARKNLLALRQGLVNRIFEEIKNQLINFAKSEEYSPWLKKKLKENSENFNPNADVIVFLKPEDMPYGQMLEKALPNCTVKPDDSIEIGGLKATSGSLMFNSSLDFALNAEKEEFYLNSGLVIN